MEPDTELQNWIRSWRSPAQSEALDERMMARYRARGRSFWSQRLELRIVLPVPMIAAAALLSIAAFGWWMAKPSDPVWEPVPAPTVIVTRAGVHQ